MPKIPTSNDPKKVDFSNDKILDWSKLKGFADDKINATEKLKFAWVRIENTVGKGENAGNLRKMRRLPPNTFYTNLPISGMPPSSPLQVYVADTARPHCLYYNGIQNGAVPAFPLVLGTTTEVRGGQVWAVWGMI